MIRLQIQSKPVQLFCSLNLDLSFINSLNCATTGGGSGHQVYDQATEQKLRTEFINKIRNATLADFNFGQLTDPDRWNKYAKGNYRTANSAFFTLLYRYNQLAKKEGKPTIEKEDIVDFIKNAVSTNNRFSIEELTAGPKVTGNDNQPVVVIKAPIEDLLKGKDLGILGATTADRLRDLGDETEMYIKLVFRDTKSRDKNGNLTVVEEGIQPISFHRDADSKITNPDPNDPQVRDKAWDTDEIPEDVIIRGPKEYFKD